MYESFGFTQLEVVLVDIPRSGMSFCFHFCLKGTELLDN